MVKPKDDVIEPRIKYQLFFGLCETSVTLYSLNLRLEPECSDPYRTDFTAVLLAEVLPRMK